MIAQESLRGKALVRDGMNRMVLGVVETVSAEVKHGVRLGIFGGVIGGIAGLINKKDVVKSATEIAVALGSIGVVWGWETAHTEHNELASQQRLRTVRWYDWVVANLLAWPQEERKTTGDRTVNIEATLIQQVVNPITVSAAKDVIKGGVQVIFG